MQDLREVHVGTFTPARWDERERVQAGWERERRDARPRIAAEDIAWMDLGLEPRWVGDDTSSVVAAIEASGFHDQGADEWRRFQAGATARSELALYVSTAEPPANEPSSVMFPRSGSVDLPYAQLSFYIRGEPIRLAREEEYEPSPDSGGPYDTGRAVHDVLEPEDARVPSRGGLAR